MINLLGNKRKFEAIRPLERKDEFMSLKQVKSMPTTDVRFRKRLRAKMMGTNIANRRSIEQLPKIPEVAIGYLLKSLREMNDTLEAIPPQPNMKQTEQVLRRDRLMKFIAKLKSPKK